MEPKEVKYKSTNASHLVEKAPVNINSTPKDTTLTIKISRPPKTEKTTYCKRCGSLVDKKNRKCTGCNKQYFRLSKVAVLWVLVGIITVGLIGLNVYQYYQTLQLNSVISELQDTMVSKSSTISDLRAKSATYKDKADFLDNEIAIVPDDGTYTYHKYGCLWLNKSSHFWAYNIEAAKAKGYKPCPYCYGS